MATGSDKRLTPAQRKKAQARYKKSGRRKDPATDLVLAAASMVPVAGAGARAAGVARAAQAAKKATMKVKEPTSNVKVIKKPRRDPGELKYRVDPIEKAAYRDAMRKKPVKSQQKRGDVSPPKLPYPKKKKVPPKKNWIGDKPNRQVRDAPPPRSGPKKKAPAKKRPMPSRTLSPREKPPVNYSAGSGKLKRTTPMTPVEIATTLSRLGYKRSPTGLEGAYKRYNAKGLNKKR